MYCESWLMFIVSLSLTIAMFISEGLSNIRVVLTNANCATPYCVDPRLKQDIRSMFVSIFWLSRRKFLITPR